MSNKLGTLTYGNKRVYKRAKRVKPPEKGTTKTVSRRSKFKPKH